MRRILLLSLLVGLATGSSLAEDAYLVTANELIAGPKSIDLAKPGTYTVKALNASGSGWIFEAKDGNATIAPGVASKGSGWATIGTLEVKTAGPLKVSMKTAETAPQTKTGKGRRVVTATRLAAVPPFVSISQDPKFEPAAAIDVIRSGTSDGIVEDRRMSVVRTNDEGADFHAPASPQAWRDRARAVREQLLVTQGLWPMPPKTDLHPRVFDKIERDGYTIEKVVIETLPGFTLSGNLYRPKGATGRLPLIMCPHGHWTDGRVNPEVQPRCVHWAKLGCVVFLYDMVGYNDTKAFGHEFLNDHLRRWGFSLVTLQTWNSIRALDFLLTLPDVDSSRVACTGESGGGTQTFLLTAIDDRVKFPAPIVMVSDSFQGGCVCENAAGLRIGTDNVEFAALAAPRPMKLVGASGDWTAKTMSNAYPTLRQVYNLVGSPDDLSADVFDFPHNYNETSRNAVYAFLAPRLLGIAPEKSKEGPVKIEEPATLWTHGEKDPRTDLKTPAQLEAELTLMQERQVDRLAPTTESAPWEASHGLIKRALEVRVGLTVPTPFELDVKPLRRKSGDSFAISHDLIGRKGKGDQVPVVRLTPTKATGRVTVVFSARGKSGLVKPDGSPRPIMAALLERGQTVVGFDPLLVGESLDPASPATQRPSVSYSDCYNPTLPADRMQDLATVFAWARSQPGVIEVNLVSAGEIAPLALLARPMLDGVARTAIDLDGFDYGDGTSKLPVGLDLPGVLQFGGLKVAAALSAPAPLWVSRAGKGFEPQWPTKSYALADAGGSLRIDPEAPEPRALALWIDTGEWPKPPTKTAQARR